MNGFGRPIRFLLGVTGGWTLLRVAMLWGDSVAPLAIVTPLPAAARAVTPRAGAPKRLPVAAVSVMVATSPPGVRRPLPMRATLAPAAAVQAPAVPLLAVLIPQAAAPAAPRWQPATTVRSPLPTARPAVWTASSWLLLRGAGAVGAAPGSQLGGGQAGVRIDRALASGLAVTGRLTSPLQGRGREAALGIAWQPAGLPVRVVAEQRIAIDGGAGGPSLLVAGGVSDLAIARGFRGEGYAQAGAIVRQGGELFVDGAARLFRPLADAGGAKFDLGLGAWGAKQRGAGRLDVGPSVALRLPLAAGGARIQLDWRQRVAGDARPGSGAALSFGADF